ncbi:hypothetical protein Tco_1175635 [Tanacetum coccineum]
MHTRTSNSELVEPLPEPERTLNRRLCRRNRRVTFNQRNNPPQNPRVVYPPILDINHFRHFLVILKNLYPMDDEPMWAADHVVAPTPGSAITIPETANEFAIKGSSNSDTNKIMARMDAMTVKMDAQYKELQSKAKKTKPDLDEDEIPMSREEEAKFMQTFSKNHQALIQNLETKFDRLADKQSGRPSGSLASNTQPNPKGHNSKAYQPPESRNEHVNVIFTRSVDAVIRVKQKQLNLGVGTERMIFNIDSAMKHSYSNDDTCFSIDVIDEILEEDFDALLNEGSKILHSIKGTLLGEEIFAEFDEFIAMTTNENSDSESDTEEPPFEKITINTDYKI